MGAPQSQTTTASPIDPAMAYRNELVCQPSQPYPTRLTLPSKKDNGSFRALFQKYTPTQIPSTPLPSSQPLRLNRPQPYLTEPQREFQSSQRSQHDLFWWLLHPRLDYSVAVTGISDGAHSSAISIAEAETNDGNDIDPVKWATLDDVNDGYWVFGAV
ncbi:hypothetical protein TARUN_10329 [Trichoderma arundinaceum]|uniref:Uncharacterized protein n=1 Tax=Trichoderma arundinaceum TaxID=490622 RepID=A0A395N740_TRIAR|nr:hypothetical protein TARUN_10329 [Trichoderma arundinaceum]